jgi:hypothetical protein
VLHNVERVGHVEDEVGDLLDSYPGNGVGAELPAKRMLLVHSVDLRGNTDESWSRSLAYLIKNSVLPADTTLR